MRVLRRSGQPPAKAGGGSHMAAGEGDQLRVSAGRLALIGVSLALVLASCGDSSSHRAADGPTTTSASTTAASSVAVLDAYRAEWAAYQSALATANAYDPSLAATMTDPLLQKVRANLLGYQNAGIVGRGSIQLNPRVVSISATTATIDDCNFSSSELVYAKTGKPVPPITPPEHDYVQATVVLVDGAWKVSQQNVTEGKCPSGM